MLNEDNYYLDSISNCLKGSVELGNQFCVAEMTMADNEIKLRIFDFNGEIKRNYAEMDSLNKITFCSGFDKFLLFGLDLNESLHMKVGNDGRFNDYTYSVQGLIRSKVNLNQSSRFSSISVSGENLKRWTGNTKKLERVIQAGLVNRLPDDNDCTLFEKNIPGLGRIGLYYSFRMGGLDGLHTVGMSVEPNFTITFIDEVDLDELIKCYTDLYMLLRFLIGEPINITYVKIHSYSCLGREGASFYLAEKKGELKRNRSSISIPYSSPYYDDSEKEFPSMIWDGYYSQDNGDIKELIKKYVSYTMVNNNDEKFLGFYRILETMTLKKSSYVDENGLTELLKQNKDIFSAKFPNASISDFFRAIKKANKSKYNTESCIHHFINDFPTLMIEELNLRSVQINDICTSRNKIIHQPLFSESADKIYRFMEVTEALAFLAILSNLGISVKKVEEIALFNGFQHIFRHK